MSFPRHLWLSVYSAKGAPATGGQPAYKESQVLAAGSEAHSFYSFDPWRLVQCLSTCCVLIFPPHRGRLINASRRLAGEGVHRGEGDTFMKVLG